MADLMQRRAAIDWEPAFPPEEYQQRLRRVRAEMAKLQIDVLYVTFPANLTYLTGYDMIWYRFNHPIGMALRADSNEYIWFDGMGHQELVAQTREIKDVVFFGHEFFGHEPEEATDTIAKHLKERGWLRGTIALEKWSPSPHGSILAQLESRFASGGARVVDGSWTVDHVRLIKTPREIEVVRKTAAAADTGMEAAKAAIRPGVSETDLEGEIMHAVMKEGGEYPAIRSMIGSGPRCSTHHSAASQRRIRQGELVTVDFCASYLRYHVDIARTFSLGEPDPRWVDMMEKASKCVERVLEAVKIGDPTQVAQDVADKYIDSVGLRKYVWFIGGYDLGIAIPPDWVGHTWLNQRVGFENATFDPGYVTNFENQFDVVDEDWPGGRGVCHIETFLMTKSGLEVLSKLPRTLTVV